MQPLLTIAHISDTHIAPDEAYGLGRGWGANAGARALVAAVNALPFQPDLVLHTGDVAYDPEAAAYPIARTILGGLHAPLRCLPGNHDDSAALQTTFWGRAVAQPYAYEAFVLNDVIIACLDSNGPAEPPRGFLPQEQLDWLEALCAADDERPLLVAVHHNPLPVGSPWLDDFMRLQNGEALHRVLLRAGRRLRGVLFGHVHQSLSIIQDGILYASAPSSWCQFIAYPGSDETAHDTSAEPGFQVVSITADQTFIRRWRMPPPAILDPSSGR